ncbi:hypothetical protein F5Y03DRAFT_333016 [Xylaria venustula]|nr:hypothetical protein F5Y03DRAFT_333016 [Xylaria venustula]
MDCPLSTEQKQDGPFYPRKGTPAPANTPSLFSSITPNTKTRSLDDMPPEILRQIWKYVAETPSWFHVKYGPTQCHPIAINPHREHWVNMKWYHAPEFRASLTHHPMHIAIYHYARRTIETGFPSCKDVGPLGARVVKAAYYMFNWCSLYSGYKPFDILLDGVKKHPIVRPTVDWFFLENYMSGFSVFRIRADDTEFKCNWYLHRVSTVVLKLEDIFAGLCRALNPRSDGSIRDPWHVNRVNDVDIMNYLLRMCKVFGALSDHNASLEKCMILIGELRPGVQPLDLQEIPVEWVCAENQVSMDIRREAIISPNVSANDRAMISFVHQELEFFAKLQREWRHIFLRGRPDFLTIIAHPPRRRFSVWLATIDGRIWREETDEGKAWQQTHSGHWWLASALGSPWLETPKGLAWLDSDAGAAFLGLPMARVWAGVDNSVPPDAMRDNVGETRAKLPEKKWFSTDKGRAWVKENCPDHRVPVAPDPPEVYPREFNTMPFPDVLFYTRPLPHWAFVMAPAKVEDESKEC